MSILKLKLIKYLGRLLFIFLLLSAKSSNAAFLGPEVDNPTGMTIGIEARYGFEIVENNEFRLKIGAKNPTTAVVTFFSLPQFNTKHDYYHAGFLTMSYLMESGVDVGVAFGYGKNNNISDSTPKFALETRSTSVMATFGYYFSFGFNLMPYIETGIGFDSIELNLESQTFFANGFTNAVYNRLAFQIGGGISMNMNNILIEAGYKFVGSANLGISENQYSPGERPLKASVDGVIFLKDTAYFISEITKYTNSNHVITAKIRYLV